MGGGGGLRDDWLWGGGEDAAGGLAGHSGGLLRGEGGIGLGGADSGAGAGTKAAGGGDGDTFERGGPGGFPESMWRACWCHAKGMMAASILAGGAESVGEGRAARPAGLASNLSVSSGASGRVMLHTVVVVAAVRLWCGRCGSAGRVGAPCSGFRCCHVEHVLLWPWPQRCCAFAVLNAASDCN